MIFRHPRDPAGPKRGLEERLQSLEKQAEVALPGFDAQFFNRAGDLCVEIQDRPRALRYYGRAIDAYLRAGRYNAAGAVCRKLLRISPTAVRARCTLAWLSIGKGLATDAQWDIDEYVQAALDAGEAELAREQIAMMAQAATGDELRALLADHLRKLGDPDGARRALEPRQPDGRDDEPEALWSRVLRAALMGPADLRDSG